MIKFISILQAKEAKKEAAQIKKKKEQALKVSSDEMSTKILNDINEETNNSNIIVSKQLFKLVLLYHLKFCT